MLKSPREILCMFPAHGSKTKVNTFRDAVQSYSAALGYETSAERNCLVIGNAEEASYLLSADTASAVLVLLEILRTLPKNRRSRAAFLLFDHPHWGLSACRKTNQLLIHIQEIGCGDILRMFPTKRLNADRRKLTSLYKACGYFGPKSLLVQEKRVLPWYVPFANAVYICSVGGKKETYAHRVKKSKTLDETNINILRAALVSYLCCDAAQ